MVFQEQHFSNCEKKQDKISESLVVHNRFWHPSVYRGERDFLVWLLKMSQKLLFLHFPFSHWPAGQEDSTPLLLFHEQKNSREKMCFLHCSITVPKVITEPFGVCILHAVRAFSELLSNDLKSLYTQAVGVYHWDSCCLKRIPKEWWSLVCHWWWVLSEL